MIENTIWEFSIFDWSHNGADGVPLAPRYVAQMLFANSTKEAREAFFVVSDAVGENGKIYPCALTVLRAVLASLPLCGSPAKLGCLELIANIAASNSADYHESIWDDCQTEIRNAFWIFASGIQFDDVALVGSYVDILGCLGLTFPSLRAISHSYLEMALTRDIPPGDVEMIKNTIRELEK